MQDKKKMYEDEMEQLMDALEKMHHAELQKHPERWANLIGSPMPAKYGSCHMSQSAVLCFLLTNICCIFRHVFLAFLRYSVWLPHVS